MSPIESLRRRTIGALLDLAVTETDPGGAGYALGMADNFREKVGPGRTCHEDYAERVESGVRKQLAHVIGFHHRGTKLRAVFDGGGCGVWVDYGDDRSAVNAHRRLSALRRGDAPPPEVKA